jgi:beta-mannosidase
VTVISLNWRDMVLSTYQFSLNGSDWRIKGFIGDDWRGQEAYAPEVNNIAWFDATVPGSIHDDLLRAGVIPDPHFEMNTLQIEWVAERSWMYRKTFTVDETLRGKRVELCFEGVDYEATFFLNGEQIGTHKSQFVPARFEVADKLNYGGENVIAVALAPAPREESQLGYTSRVRTHRTRMNEWWDFCPRIRHIGLWDDVYLKVTGEARIEDVWVRPHLAQKLDHALIGLVTTLSGAGRVETTVETGASTVWQGEGASTAFSIEPPELWYPNGYGEQPLYRAKVRVYDSDGHLSDERSVPFGLRRVEWTGNDITPGSPNENARPYTLLVNNRKVYINGWNWVPMDAFYGVKRHTKLRYLLYLAQNANVNLLRLNGVGLIEKEAFYNLCDESGIMIWQEFILSSSSLDRKPSEDPAYINHVVEEAESIIPRKRNHPSLVIWCGGNELEGLDKLPLDDDEPVLSALKQTVEQLDPSRLWLPTCGSGPMPYCGINTATNNPFIMHDVHGPWHHQGLTDQYTLFNRSRALLHSEFGAEGLTNYRTLQELIAPEHQYPVALENLVWRHLGAGWWVKREKWREMLGEWADKAAEGDLSLLVKTTQYLQAEAVRYGIESNRRRMGENSGSLPWQFNEPYPMAACTSAVDYYGRPKPLYYAVARAYRRVLFSAKFDGQTWKDKNDFSAEIWVSLSSGKIYEEEVIKAELIGASGKVYAQMEWKIVVEPYISVKIGDFTANLAEVEEVFFLRLSSENYVANTYLFTREENLAPAISLPKAELEIEIENNDDVLWSIRITNTSSTAALFVNLTDDREVTTDRACSFTNENYFTILPNEETEIIVSWWGNEPDPEGKRRVRVSGWNIEDRVVRL